MPAPRVPAPSMQQTKTPLQTLQDKINNGGMTPVPPKKTGGLYRLGPNLGDSESVDAFRKARENAKRLKDEAARPRGRLATLFTGGAGLLDEPSTSRRTLLGY